MLSHLRVLDFSTLLPGPYASMMLADMGADVLRVESPYRPDMLKKMPPFDGNTDNGENSAAYMYLNRSKRLMALDLKQQEAIRIVEKLILEYDIILEQFRPGVMDRLGLGYKALSKINSKVIYCSITGYGQNGPYKDRAGHDINYLALSGLANYSRRKDAAPVPIGTQIADIAGGSMHAVAGILASVSHRQLTGKGQAIDISMTDASFALNALPATHCLVGDQMPDTEEMLLNGGSFYDYYQTRDGRYFSVGSLEPQFFSQLIAAFGRPDWHGLADNLFVVGKQKSRKATEHLKQEIKKEFLQRDFKQLQELFAKFDACVEPVLTFTEAAKHPQIKSRNMVVDVPKPNGQPQKQLGHPIKYSDYSAKYPGAADSPGKHTIGVLKEFDYTDSEIQKLSAKGII